MPRLHTCRRPLQPARLLPGAPIGCPPTVPAPLPPPPSPIGWCSACRRCAAPQPTRAAPWTVSNRLVSIPAACPLQALRITSVYSSWSVAYSLDEAAFVNDFQRVVQRMHQASRSRGVALRCVAVRRFALNAQRLRAWGGGHQACACARCRAQPASTQAQGPLPGSTPPPTAPAWLQLGAGETWTVDASYKWRGLKGDWKGWGPDIKPQASCCWACPPASLPPRLLPACPRARPPARPPTCLSARLLLASLPACLPARTPARRLLVTLPTPALGLASHPESPPPPPVRLRGPANPGSLRGPRMLLRPGVLHASLWLLKEPTREDAKRACCARCGASTPGWQVVRAATCWRGAPAALAAPRRPCAGGLHSSGAVAWRVAPGLRWPPLA